MRSNNSLFGVKCRQSGAAILLIMFILGMGVIAFMLKSMSTDSFETQERQKTYSVLEEAKATLIGWSVSHSLYPGQMPWPDRNGDGDYDGTSDCATNSFSTTLFIGQLPFKPSTNNCLSYPGLGNDFIDPLGNRLWYAVSGNLLRNYKDNVNPVVNPGIIDSQTWIKVLDRNGNLISDRVAVVIIAPGKPLPGQDRTGVPDVEEYLDSLQIGSKLYSNQDYDTDDEDFIIAPDSLTHPATDTTYQSPYNFNDQLVYITIDELIVALERRVAGELKTALNDYKSDHGNFPYASPFGIDSGLSCKSGNTYGMLPIDGSSTCNYSYQKTSGGSGLGELFGSGLKFTVQSNCVSVSFSKVIFERVSGADYQSASDGCSFAGKYCTCTGAGSCSGTGTPTFSCTISGGSTLCNSSEHKDNQDSKLVFQGGYFSQASGACGPTLPVCESQKGYPITCLGGSNDTTGNFSNSCAEPKLDLTPTWITNNKWHNYFYFASSRDIATKLGNGAATSANGSAIVIAMGKPITTVPYAESKTSTPQQRLSCNLNDYLDSVENTDGDIVYDPTSKIRKQNYNDQVFIVAP